MTDLTRASSGEFGGVGAAARSEHDQTPAQIESEIRRTRDRMSDDIDAIGDKLSPDRIKQRAKQAVSRKTRGILRRARENPLPAALVAIGITWLLKSRSRHGALESAKGNVADAKDAGTVQRFFEQNPLIGAVGVMALGAVIGAALPHTEKEDRLMGSARDALVEKAQDAAEHAKTTLKETASQSPARGESYGTQRQ